MLKLLIVAAAAGTVLLLGVIAAQPDHYQVTRSITIQAPADSVYSHIHDFQNWSAWSPWAQLDPQMKETFSGPQYGPGSAYDWSGNNRVGRGRMTILETQAPSLLRIRLEFFEPFPSEAHVAFKLQQLQPNATRISWTMSGASDFLSKAMCLFFGGMDRMIGPDFDSGLARLKSTTESHP